MRSGKEDEGSYLGRFARLLKRPGVRLRRIDTGVRQDLYGARHALSYVRHLARGNRIQRKAFFDTVDETQPPVLLIHG